VFLFVDSQDSFNIWLILLKHSSSRKVIVFPLSEIIKLQLKIVDTEEKQTMFKNLRIFSCSARRKKC